ncbi:zf-HC2 domain-containing protein [Psychrobacter sp. I-STPA6b]|uniref:zf-HC2 domain-containing protein n=1 Tax=Psychrobacter sp. I-STPA6b TaxID=2585718 RepID=UPI001D0CA688|nr:zf-HC2 domain-containing protein [Psychrobacter sp. I-STPA6b]
MKNCQQITQLASDAQDRPLSTGEKFQLHTHVMMCKGCRAFYKNTDTLSQIMKTLKEVEGQENQKGGE